MNDFTKRLITNRGGYGRYPNEYNDYASRGTYEVMGDYESYDGRRGVKGTGRYGMGGSKYYPRRDRSMGYDYEPEYDERDYYMKDMHHMDYSGSAHMYLSKREMQEWKRNMENADGSMGEHFRDMQQILNVAQQQGVQFKDFDEKDLCLTVNMLYSDFSEALRPFITPDKELTAYVRLARAWLEDEDTVKGKEKLYVYYKCVVENDEY